MTEETIPNLIDSTVEIVSAYLAQNRLAPEDVPNLIQNVHASLTGLGGGADVSSEIDVERPTTAQIRKSITPDSLISFEDGKSYKTLKRHLSTRGLTPDDYRSKWGLPHDYPIVSSNYSAARSALAKQMGLGAKGRKAAAKRTKKAVSS